jgi:hypothetical protein
MTQIKCFNDWWKINGNDYEEEGVSKIVAKSIWDAAIDLVSKEINKLTPNEN